jgi:hypothetical protein
VQVVGDGDAYKDLFVLRGAEHLLLGEFGCGREDQQRGHKGDIEDQWT